MPFQRPILKKGRVDENISVRGFQLRSKEVSIAFGCLTGLGKQKLDLRAIKIHRR